MSVASSAASCISVAYDGQVTNLEDALDSMMKEMQKLLNDLHSDVREMIGEGPAADPEAFKERVEYIDDVSDLIKRMVRLVEEVPTMAKDIQGTAPAECKEWYKMHMLTRKTQLAAVKSDQKAAEERAKMELKFKQADSKEPLVAFDGHVGSPNMALDYGMDSIQRLMNNLHMDMRKLASLTEQEIDPDEDYKESVEFAERSTDIVTKLVWLLERVNMLVAGFLGKVPNECKAWHAEHVAERKAALVVDKAAHIAAANQAKLALRAQLLAEQ